MNHYWPTVMILGTCRWEVRLLRSVTVLRCSLFHRCMREFGRLPNRIVGTQLATSLNDNLSLYTSLTITSILRHFILIKTTLNKERDIPLIWEMDRKQIRYWPEYGQSYRMTLRAVFCFGCLVHNRPCSGTHSPALLSSELNCILASYTTVLIAME